MHCLSLEASMKRREFIGLVGGVAAWPLGARAQTTTMSVIGFLLEGSQLRGGAEAAFHAGLQDVGLIVGQNVRIEYRRAEERYERLPGLAAELVALRPNLLVATGSAGATALKNATNSLPIVFLSVGDPVGIGLVQSLSRPGGNLTGLAVYVPGEFFGKMIETLKEVVPSASKVAILFNPGNQVHRLIIADDVPRAVQTMRVALLTVEVRTVDEIASAVASTAAQNVDAMVVLADTVLNGPQTAAVAADHRLPTLSLFRLFPSYGGLMSYGPDLNDLFRRGGFYVDRILRGAHPRDLPIQQPTKFQLVVNLKTAKALGIVVPPALLARADEVIE
jgi:putative ABC transport system substrate-binding protein